MKTLKAIDIQIIAKGMLIKRLEDELQTNRDRLTKCELSEWARKLKQDKLRAAQKEYKRLCKAWGYDIEADRERADMNRFEEQREFSQKFYNDREEYLNSMWLESYDVRCDEQYLD